MEQIQQLSVIWQQELVNVGQSQTESQRCKQDTATAAAVLNKYRRWQRYSSSNEVLRDSTEG
jgi:hypothetical protein